ncbi:hypothetical protein DRO47_06620 [Candidatus Bathyarchaeota archaeon]|nr:MAG: hypothetical protein DRO47_06620 [Candidatus Bathyarchaeota archaeon]
MSEKFLKYLGELWKSYILLFALFIWLRIIFLRLDELLNGTAVMYSEKLVTHAIYYFSAGVFSLLGAIFLEKIQKELSIRVWISTTMISCLIFLFTFDSNIMRVLYPLFGGISFGLGVPVTFSYFADHTSVVNRGRLGSIAFFLISLTLPVLTIASKILTINIILALFLIFLGFNSIFFRFYKQENRIVRKERIRYSHILTDKKFLYYFISWCMFCFIDALEAPLLEDFLINTFGSALRDFVLFLETIVTSFSILVVGFLIDLYGRKRVLIYGFVSLGVAHATAGVFAYSILSWYIYSVIAGIALGFFIVIFVFTVWGDISPKNAREKYYAAGVLPYLFGGFISELSMPHVTAIPISSSFSLASFFLFLAVIPLTYAPETLPEKVIRRRELREYVEKAKKIREKYEKTGN